MGLKRKTIKTLVLCSMAFFSSAAFASNMELAFSEPIKSARDLALALQRVEEMYTVENGEFYCSVNANVVSVRPVDGIYAAKAVLWVALAPGTDPRCRRSILAYKREHLRSIPGTTVLD